MFCEEIPKKTRVPIPIKLDLKIPLDSEPSFAGSKKIPRFSQRGFLVGLHPKSMCCPFT